MKQQKKMCKIWYIKNNIVYLQRLLNKLRTLSMKKQNIFYRAYDLYADGFRNMTLGKTLWAVILIKLFIIFAVLKLFFFPDFLSTHAEKGGEADYVASKTLNIKE